MFERNLKNKVLKKLEELNVNYKLVPSEDYTDLVLYPDNYSVDNVWFSLYRFYDVRDTEVLAEDKDGKRVYVTEVLADNFQMLESNSNKTEKGKTKSNQDKDPFAGAPMEVSDDDLPF